MIEDFFCAKTGQRIVDDNVIPFPRRDDGPVPAATMREAERQTIRPTLATGRMIDELCDAAAAEEFARLAPEFEPNTVPFLAPEDDPI
jgi:hypothetical protein